MKVLVTGSRDWVDTQLLKDALVAARATVVIHGDARGADRIAKDVARSLGLTERAYPAQWNIHGRKAGPLRNQQMLDEEHTEAEPINLVLAFPMPGSIGTWDMVRRAEKLGLNVKIYPGG
jgi:hypothetical protein